MTDRDLTVEQKMANLKLAYANNLPDKINDIAEGWSQLKDNWQRKLADEEYRLIHSLCGSSGSYGATGVNKHARGLEQCILTIIYDERTPTAEEIITIERLIGRTRKAAENWVAVVTSQFASAKTGQRQDAKTGSIYILDTDDLFTAPLVSELANHGYQVKLFKDQGLLLDQFIDERPGLIIAAEESLAGNKFLNQAGGDRKLLPPMIVVSLVDSMESRLKAVSEGALYYFCKPILIPEFMVTINGILKPKPDNPYRVLIVDDDKSVGKLHAVILNAAGVETSLVTDSLVALDSISRFNPDLILMDVHMPGCSGPDLAAVIRQDEHYQDLPILFLSADSAIEEQLHALALGGEDYLTKPINEKWLVDSVVSRIKKQRSSVLANSSLSRARKESQYRELAIDQHVIVSVANADGAITFVNSKFCEISGYSREELIGQDHNIVNSGHHEAEFFKDMWKTITAGKVWNGEICNLSKNGRTYWVESTIVPFMDKEGRPYQYVSMRTDITRIKLLELELSRHAELLDALHVAMTGFMSAGQFNNVVGLLLENMIKLTGSRYGIMAEVLFDEDTPYLRTHAISNLGWNKPLREEYAHINKEGLRLDNQHHLLDAVHKSGEVIISEDIANDPRAGGLPGCSNEFTKFLGVPVYYGDQLIGIYGFARKDESYSVDIVSFLDAFNATYGVMIHAKRVAEMEGEVNFYLDQARNEAVSANRAKSEFLSNMSHELRTPLNVILGFAQLMSADIQQELSSSQKENAQEILRAGHHLLDLVNEVLDLSKIESGKLVLNFESVRVDAVIGDCISLVGTLADKKNIEITCVRDACANQSINADVTRLSQALINFLSNAVKYTPENGKVRVTCAESADFSLRITVSDSGPGIAEENKDQIFTPFNRLGAEISGVEGTGIGLVITKNLVERMSGSVGYERNELGGSDFWMELPLDRATLETAPNLVIEQQGKNEPELGSSMQDNVCQLLYIEDNPANLNLVKQLIGRRSNMKLLTASEPEKGLQLIAENKFDVVLLDINLPVMSGYEVLAKIRADNETSELLVIAVSANAMPADIQQGQDAGFDDYITKPIQLDDFFLIIDRVLAQRSK